MDAEQVGAIPETRSAETFDSGMDSPGAASIEPSTADDESRTVDCVWYGGATVPRIDQKTGNPYLLKLDMAGCRIGRLNAGAPVFDSHMTGQDFDSLVAGRMGTKAQVGVVRKAWADGDKGKATLQFKSGDPAADQLWSDIKSGIVQNLSFGAWIYAKESLDAAAGETSNSFRATDWEPFEISPVTVPADFSTTFLSAETGATDVLPGKATSAVAEPSPPAVETPPEAIRATAAQLKETPVDNNTQATGVEARPNDTILAAEREAAIKAERERGSAIRLMAEPFGLEAAFVNGLIDAGHTIEMAREKVMEKVASEYAKIKIDPPNRPEVTRDANETRRECMEAALMLRSDARNKEYEKGREYYGLSLIEMARECLNAAGMNTRNLSRDQVARVALEGRASSEYFTGGLMSTSDFPNILANVARKSLRIAYEAAPRTYQPLVRVVSAQDFKPLNRVQLSDIAALQKMNESGEYHTTALSDSKETYSLATYGEKVAITRRTIINDDLGALTRVPALLGQAAARTESDLTWAVIIGNAAMSDGVAIFHASHSNLNTSNALATAALATARTAMRKQQGPKGTILNLVPKFLVAPAALEQTALQLINPTMFAPTSAANIIPGWITSLTLVVEPRLDAATNGSTNWFLAADPSSIDGLEACYLSGNEGVFIETRQAFDLDGFEIRARLDFAAAMVEYRGWAKNTA